MWSLPSCREVEKLAARGISDSAIAAITGVPLSTVGNWGRHPDRGPREKEPLEEWLIHSDGCRTTNRFKVKLPSGRVGEYEYPRYFFSNLSEDIRRIFCDHCELLGIRWTQSNPRNISISPRKSVGRLDEFIGPKW